MKKKINEQNDYQKKKRKKKRKRPQRGNESQNPKKVPYSIWKTIFLIVAPAF